MAKIYGGTVTTPIKPDVFVNNKPTIYEGTIINSFDASTTGGIFGKGEFALGGNTVSEFWLNLKVGDLYYNTDEKKTYLCLSVSVDDNKARADATWKDLNVKPDEVYNPQSANAQSGKALAEVYGMLTDDFAQADWQFWNTIGKVYVDEKVNEVKGGTLVFYNGDAITLSDNGTHTAEEPISELTINYPDGDFISSIVFTTASEGVINITLPESKYIGEAPTFLNGETWELNIRNGVVVGGLIE